MKPTGHAVLHATLSSYQNIASIISNGSIVRPAVKRLIYCSVALRGDPLVPSSDVRRESVLIGKRDRGRLTQYVAAWEAKLSRDAKYLAKVRARLSSSVELPEDLVPATQVTIGSQVCIRDLDTGKSFVWTVALPPDDEVALTVRSPLSWSAATLIGAREGDEILLDSPAGRRRVRIEAVLFQPEVPQARPPARRSASC